MTHVSTILFAMLLLISTPSSQSSSLLFFSSFPPSMSLLSSLPLPFVPSTLCTFVLSPLHLSLSVYLYLPLITARLCFFRSEVGDFYMTSELKQHCLLTSPLMCCVSRHTHTLLPDIFGLCRVWWRWSRIQSCCTIVHPTCSLRRTQS